MYCRCDDETQSNGDAADDDCQCYVLFLNQLFPKVVRCEFVYNKESKAEDDQAQYGIDEGIGDEYPVHRLSGSVICVECLG